LTTSALKTIEHISCNMTWIAVSLLTVWLIGLLTLIWRYMESIRIIHNNLTPEATDLGYMKPGWRSFLWFRFAGINPLRLNFVGRSRLNGAIWNERAMYAWMAAGLFLLAYLF